MNKKELLDLYIKQSNLSQEQLEEKGYWRVTKYYGKFDYKYYYGRLINLLEDIIDDGQLTFFDSINNTFSGPFYSKIKVKNVDCCFSVLDFTD